MKIRDEIKGLIVSSGFTIEEVAREISEILNKPYSGRSLSQKMRNGTIRFDEARAVAKVLSLELEFKKPNSAD